MLDIARPNPPVLEAIRGFAEESLAAVAVLQGAALRLTYCNPAFSAAAGRPAEALWHLPLAEAFPALLAGGQVGRLGALLAGGRCHQTARLLSCGPPAGYGTSRSHHCAGWRAAGCWSSCARRRSGRRRLPRRATAPWSIPSRWWSGPPRPMAGCCSPVIGRR
ncbi:PAS domain-containing protein [Siccirubricoccus deserti]